MKTLKEVCTELGVSRRAVQGYEEAGLVKATRKNKYGYLLYNQYAQERIERIKFLQDLGFSLKEIEQLIDAPKNVLREQLEMQIERLVVKIDQKRATIQKARELINTLSAEDNL